MTNSEKTEKRKTEHFNDDTIEEISIEDLVVDELNKTLAIVHTTSMYILIEKGETEFVLDTKSSLLNLYENQIVSVGKSFKTKAQIWLKSPRRRTYNYIVFDPKRPGHYEDKYNIFKGFAVSPTQGDCSLFWEHVRYIICGGNEEHYLYVRKWLAHLIQHPWIISTALVLRGKQGTGKGVFVHAIGELFGPHYAHLSSLERILGRFNSHLKNAVLIFADEALWGGNKKEVGPLKALVTEPKLFIEGKGKDGYWVDNYKHLIAASNENWAVPLDPDDRRFFVLEVSQDRKEDFSYFDAITQQLKHGGYEALMYDLQHEDIIGFDPKKMPQNNAGFDMKLQSTSSIDRYVYESLKEGCWDHYCQLPDVELKNLSIQEFYSRYKLWCEEENQHSLIKEQVGRRIKELIPQIEVKRGSRKEGPKRPNQYIFPPLEVCRQSFEKFYKQSSHIWELS